MYGNDLKKEVQSQMVKTAIDKNGKKSTSEDQNADINPLKVVEEVKNSVNIPLLVGCFLFFYFFGYLLYSSLFAAIGSAAESAAASQAASFAMSATRFIMACSEPSSATPPTPTMKARYRGQPIMVWVQ